MGRRKKKKTKGNIASFFVIAVCAVSIALMILLVNGYFEKNDIFSGETTKNDGQIHTETQSVSDTQDKAETPIEPIKIPQEQKPPQTTDPLSDPAANIPVTADREWNLILVNPWNKLPPDFDVELTGLKDGHFVDERAYPDLQDMMDAARSEGLSPWICSSYRTQNKQTTLYKNEVNSYLQNGYTMEEAIAEAGKWVAIPGTSEHQTGLALDIVAISYPYLNSQQENTAEQQWLMQNSYKYGWVLRYPSDKSAITGIYYEPWHYRYVGKEAAMVMYEQGLCFEEYLALSEANQ